MQTALSTIWTWLAETSSFDDNHYATSLHHKNCFLWSILSKEWESRFSYGYKESLVVIHISYVVHLWGLVWFLCLMAYQYLWVIWCQSHSCRKTGWGLAAGAHVVVGGCRWKSRHRKIVPLSYVEKPFNSKVIKSFVPELRSRQVFFVFRDSYVIYICALWTLWTFCIPVWICTFHIFMDGYVTLCHQPSQLGL